MRTNLLFQTSFSLFSFEILFSNSFNFSRLCCFIFGEILSLRFLSA